MNSHKSLCWAAEKCVGRIVRIEPPIATHRLEPLNPGKQQSHTASSSRKPALHPRRQRMGPSSLQL